MLPPWLLPAILGAVVLAMVIVALPAAARTFRALWWYSRALRAYQKGRMDAAQAMWERTTRIAPWYSSAYYNLGVLHAKAGRFDQAVAAYEQAVKLNQSRPKPWFNLGNAYLAKEEYRAAARAYEAATQTPRGHARSHLNLGVLYQEHLLDDQKALYHFTEYLRLGGNDLRVLQNIKRLQEKLKR